MDRNLEVLIQLFQNNAWKKRGISLVPLRWRHDYSLHFFTCQVAIFHGDGSVAVTTGGIEMGQGLNTKVAQVVAT